MIGGERAKRLAAIVVIALLHAGVAVFLLSPRTPPAVRPLAAAMTIFRVPALPVARETIVTTLAIAIPAPSFDIAPTTVAPPAVAPPCDVAAAVRDALGRDPVAATALAPVADDPRHAVMLWDGGWLQRAADDPARRIVTAAVSTAPAACLDEVQTGPRLVIVMVDTTTLAIAVGSGVWRWRDLLSLDQ